MYILNFLLRNVKISYRVIKYILHTTNFIKNYLYPDTNKSKSD